GAVLPVEVPVLDPQQRLRRAVRQRGRGLELLAEIVGVRARRQQQHVVGDPERCVDGELFLAGRNVDPRLQAEETRHRRLENSARRRGRGGGGTELPRLAFLCCVRVQLQL